MSKSVSILAIGCLFFTTGCEMFVGVSTIDGPDAVVEAKKATTTEIVSLSEQSIVTSGQYKVQSSIGYHSGAPEVTTSGGYRVSTSVQGAIFKE